MNLRSDSTILAISQDAGHVGGGYYRNLLSWREVLSSVDVDRLCRVPLAITTESGRHPTYHVAGLYRQLTSGQRIEKADPSVARSPPRTRDNNQ
jgi:hypothetical protein